jgi:hypothetical protein
MTNATKATWEILARAEGWAENGTELRNDRLDRDWPDHDWEAAARDAGVDEEEADDFERGIPSYASDSAA